MPLNPMFGVGASWFAKLLIKAQVSVEQIDDWFIIL